MTLVTPCLEQTFNTVTESLLAGERRLLLFGEPGSGKSTLAAQLAAELEHAGSTCFCVGADPGSPAFGVPGAICLGQWRNGAWQLLAMEVLCSLDAGRFRLPLLDGVRRLVDSLSGGMLFIDSPGVVRGVAGAELLTGLVLAAGVDTILCITRNGQALPLINELAATGCELWMVKAANEARQPAKKARARARTRLWDAYMAASDEYEAQLDRVAVLGTPPPANADQLWVGRQAGLLDSQRRTLALAEVVGKDGNRLRLRHPTLEGEASILVVRDAQRLARGVLGTARPDIARTDWYTPPPDMLARQAATPGGGPRPVLQVGSATATLLNGVFGDPLLHLRLRHRRRSLLFDLGEAGRLPARVAHQVTDVFISHAHFDHIGGFLWLLRSRIGVLDVCRLYGPPGLAKHIQSFIDAIHWDRIGEGGPRFEVTELHGRRLVRVSLQVGRPDAQLLDEAEAEDGLLLDDRDFRVRATELDHGIPVLAFAAKSPRSLKVRKDQLEVMDLPVGPWLGELKACIARDAADTLVELPDGRCESAAVLAERLLLIQPGETLVYATDLADSADNRARLTRLAQGAHTFFCEAVFTQEDVAQAGMTRHLTARACGEIATAAGVERLIPFHFSKRYEDEPERIYNEVAAVCARLIMPKPGKRHGN
jgi:ribonuclease BN (tRNA processing enzyme)